MVIFISEEEIETLKQQLAEKEEQLAEKDTKMKNQANELNHLTNETIPELKKENKQLKALKVELTDALEKSTKKYFEQLEINADLSESVAKKGAGLQLAKVRLEEIEKLVVELEQKNQEEKAAREAIPTKETDEDEVRKIYQENQETIEKLHGEIEDLEKELKKKDNEIDRKNNQVKEKDDEIKDLNDNVIPKLKSEVADLTSKVKATKEEAQKELDGVGGKIAKLEAEIKDLSTKLDNKKRDYDRLSTESNNKDKTINSLKNKVSQLSDQMKEESSKGFFSKLTGR